MLAKVLTTDGADNNTARWGATKPTVTNNANGKHVNARFGTVTTAPLAGPYLTVGGTSTNGCYTAIGNNAEENAIRMNVGGFTLGGSPCSQVAADGYVISGINVFYRIGVDLTLADHASAITSYRPVAKTFNQLITELTGFAGAHPYSLTIGDPATTTKGFNVGSISHVYSNPNVEGTGAGNQMYENWWLITSHQNYSDSMMITNIGNNAGLMDTPNGLSISWFDKTKYGSIYAAWIYDKDYNSTEVKLRYAVPDGVLFCGTHKNWGLCVHWAWVAGDNTTSTKTTGKPNGVTSAALFTSGTNVTSDNALKILAPSGGVG